MANKARSASFSSEISVPRSLTAGCVVGEILGRFSHQVGGLNDSSGVENSVTQVTAALSGIRNHLLRYGRDVFETVIVRPSSDSNFVWVSADSPGGVRHKVAIYTDRPGWEETLWLSMREILQVSAG